jgi:hypothetical protein
MLAGTQAYVVARIGGPDGPIQPDRVRADEDYGLGWCGWRDFMAAPAEASRVDPFRMQMRDVDPAAPLPDDNRSETGDPLPFGFYPHRDINRSIRTGVETAILVKVHFQGDPVTWPDETQAVNLAMAVENLSQANAYGGGHRIVFIASPDGGGLVFEVTIASERGPSVSPAQVMDAVREFDRVYPLRASDFDHVIMITPPTTIASTQGYTAINMGKYVVFTEVGGQFFSHRRPNGEEDFAPGVLHEIGHGYQLSHASTYAPGAEVENVEYGDIYDFMGEMSLLGWRFNQQCRPIGQVPNFAPTSEIHLNPIRKWQFGWFDDTAIRKILPGEITSPAIALSPIDSPTGIRAIQIERGIEIEDGSETPVSLLIYWRRNEPMISGGVCIARVSRELMQAKTRLLDRIPGPPEGAGCFGPAPVIPFPGWNVTLPIGQTYTDVGGSGAKITVLEPPPDVGRDRGPATTLAIHVDNSAQPTSPLRNLPILEVTSPIIESGRVITSQDTVAIYVTATNPDKDPLRFGWKDVHYVELEFLWKEKSSPVPPPQLWQASTGKQVVIRLSRPGWIRIPASDFRTLDPENFPNQDPIRKIIGVSVSAYTLSQPQRIIYGGLRFLLDQS